MPHKKNPINCEKVCGMSRAISGYAKMIVTNIETTEERAIEQSCVERIAWPDIFHAILHSLKTLNRVLKGLAVYPDNMMKEIVSLKGLYASDEAKNFLGKHLAQQGVEAETAYRIVQLASFQIKSPHPLSIEMEIRNNPPSEPEEMTSWLGRFGGKKQIREDSGHLRDIILECKLEPVGDLGHSVDTVQEWNRILGTVFHSNSAESSDTRRDWKRLFWPDRLLAQEAHLFKEVFGV